MLVAASLLLVGCAFAQDKPTDVSGIWQLNDKASDSATDIAQRLRAEKRREEAPSSNPAAASSSGTPAAPSHAFGGRGGGHGMGGGRHGSGSQDSQDSSSSKGTPKKSPSPPLLADDGMLNVQQTSQGMRVDYNNTDRLDTKFDGIARQSLNGSAQVRTQQTPSGIQVSMQFDDGTRLDQAWVRSADGHHLTVTETWTGTEVQAPIVFKRSYDRLDL